MLYASMIVSSWKNLLFIIIPIFEALYFSELCISFVCFINNFSEIQGNRCRYDRQDHGCTLILQNRAQQQRRRTTLIWWSFLPVAAAAARAPLRY